MNAIFLAILLTCSVMLSGCSRRNRPSGEKVPEKIGELMLRIENATVDENILTLDYKVSNRFEFDIWVCQDIDIYGGFDVETRITPGALQIKLCFDLECNLIFYRSVFAKYRLLKPGESNSGTILLSLPVRNASPVYDFNEDRTKYRRTVLNRVVFEVGYINGEDINKALEFAKRDKQNIPSGNILVGAPEMREEIIDGQLCKFAIVPQVWEGLVKEKSVKVVVTEVEVPCLTVGETRETRN